MLSTAVDIAQNYMNITLDLCALKHEDFIIPDGGTYCNWTFDSFLCWPPTLAGKVVRQKCPIRHGIDSTKSAERRCSSEGQWESRFGEPDPVGWTNFTPCFRPEVNQLLKKIYAGGNDDVGKIKFSIAERTRSLEIFGLSLSLLALLISLMIFCYFRSLRNNRTRIHKNLFVAMVIQVIIRLTLYLDQALLRSQESGNGSVSGIDNTPFLCEASYVLLEYARTAMFMWMFIEGLYLHNVVTVTVFQDRFRLHLYAILGWGGPLIMTAIWAGLTSYYKKGEKCWWGYNLTPLYWILEGPRLAVILLNFFFLLNIIRVLVVKLRQSHTSEVEQVRKAVRAAVVLLPLLGITNLLLMSEAPLEKSAFQFALWSYVTHFFTSFQGFFIAMLYCFLNGEVRAVLLKSISVYLSTRGYGDWNPRRHSMFSANYATAPVSEPPAVDETPNSTQPTSRRHRNWCTFCFPERKIAKESNGNGTVKITSTLPPESVLHI
ncbi:PDF receptor isoform X2 [Bradysia coprophila]|uniref:PDF receptor isoform X2 n=1 Tax=Bradysia coprophila TaxID=38358 RepID=UPI00187D6F7A|nr:PDF receptor isoform X2 [Bradysia coprophila]